MTLNFEFNESHSGYVMYIIQMRTVNLNYPRKKFNVK